MAGRQVDVMLPLPITDDQTTEQLKALYTKLQDGMLAENYFLAPLVHDRKWWVRASAQIWLEVKDFQIIAQKLLELCRTLQVADEERT